MYDSETQDVFKCSCGWIGCFEQTADDGPGFEICCPLCGSAFLKTVERTHVVPAVVASSVQEP